MDRPRLPRTFRTMLIGATALALVGASVSSAAAAQSESIVVTAKKLRHWRGVLIVGQADSIRCQVTRSSGDTALDTLGCDGMKQCFAAERPEFEAARAKSVTAAARRRLLTAANVELSSCFAKVDDRLAAYPLDGQTPPSSGDAS